MRAWLQERAGSGREVSFLPGSSPHRVPPLLHCRHVMSCILTVISQAPRAAHIPLSLCSPAIPRPNAPSAFPHSSAGDFTRGFHAQGPLPVVSFLDLSVLHAADIPFRCDVDGRLRRNMRSESLPRCMVIFSASLITSSCGFCSHYCFGDAFFRFAERRHHPREFLVSHKCGLLLHLLDLFPIYVPFPLYSITI